MAFEAPRDRFETRCGFCTGLNRIVTLSRGTCVASIRIRTHLRRIAQAHVAFPQCNVTSYETTISLP
jgi:hypothetical protein